MIRVLDIESTGLSPESDAIVEIASVDIKKLPDSSFGITNEREDLVFPVRGIPPEASAVHHLIDADVAAADRIEKVIEAYKGATAYVAHRCEFEKSFLERHLGPQTWVCTYKCALRAWPEAPGHSNQILRYWLGLTTPFGRPRGSLAPHRALSDAIVTAGIFVELSKKAKWSELLAWSQEPALYTTLTFGKHRGTKYADADPTYLEWVCEKSDWDADTKFSARHWLQVRAAV